MLATFSASLGLAVITPFLPELAQSHGANGFWIGMIFAGFGISRGIVTPFIGKVSDRVGRKIFVVVGLIIYTAVSIFYTKADSVYFLTLVRLIQGLSAGMILPIVMTYIGELSKRGKEGLTTGVMNTVVFLGVAIGPLAGGELAERFGFNSVFYAMAALGAATLLLTVFFLPEANPVQSRKAPGLNGAKGTVPKEKSRPKEPLNVFLRHNYVKSVLIMTFVSVALTAVFMSFLPSVAVSDEVDMMHIGFIVSFAIILAGILQIPLGRFAEHQTRLGQLLQTSLGVSISMMAIFVLPSCPDFKSLMLAGGFMGIGVGIATAAFSYIAIRIGKAIGMGTWMGIFWAVMSAGLVIAPIGAGIIMDRMGIDPIFYSFGIFAFFTIILSIYLARHKEEA